jgi:pyruvate dehydrogenase E2 component (dihydrolipoamide acetyltransferase)
MGKVANKNNGLRMVLSGRQRCGIVAQTAARGDSDSREAHNSPMSEIVEVILPEFPSCWESCGDCGRGAVTVDDILVHEGERVEAESPLLVLETGKVALDLPSPCAGDVVAILVEPGEVVRPGQVMLLLEC